MFLKKSIAVLAAAVVVPSFNGLALASDIQAHADGETDGDLSVMFHDTSHRLFVFYNLTILLISFHIPYNEMCWSREIL